ncbi:MAG: hypothetical protein JXX29_17280 [Deltaproteobacteria bacterium]|nr:hypothetical protein [Deltaproteobacteria bacterium]MBN2673438.1 hypothetical protein [Deltaproteobacteria bacterium]
MKHYQIPKYIFLLALLSSGWLSGGHAHAQDTDVTTDAQESGTLEDTEAEAEAPAIVSDDISDSAEQAAVEPPLSAIETETPTAVKEPAIAPPPPPIVQYYVLRISLTQPEGPYTKADIEQRIAQKQISHYDQIQTAGTNSWSRAFEVFPDAVYATKPEIEVSRRYGLFSSPYRIKVDGKPYSLKRKMKYQGTVSIGLEQYAQFSMSGFLYPADREEILKIPEAYRSGQTFPEYFWPSPLGMHTIQSGVNPGVISKREFSRKYAVLPLLGLGVCFMALPFVMGEPDSDGFSRLSMGLLISGASLTTFAFLINAISRRNTYRYLKRLETVQ